MSLSEVCKVIRFNLSGDERGKLIAIEGNQTIPFDIKRIFYIYGTSNDGVRGQHANKESEFILINVSGKSKVRLTDGENSYVVELNEPSKGVYIPKMIWKEMFDFSNDSVLLVLASTHYNANEYIKDFDEYLKIIRR